MRIREGGATTVVDVDGVDADGTPLQVTIRRYRVLDAEGKPRH